MGWEPLVLESRHCAVTDYCWRAKVRQPAPTAGHAYDSPRDSSPGEPPDATALTKATQSRGTSPRSPAIPWKLRDGKNGCNLKPLCLGSVHYVPINNSNNSRFVFIGKWHRFKILPVFSKAEWGGNKALCLSGGSQEKQLRRRWKD